MDRIFLEITALKGMEIIKIMKGHIKRASKNRRMKKDMLLTKRK